MGTKPQRGINFGGALDGIPRNSTGWLQEHHFDVVRDAGFDTVRLPVQWSAHADSDAPFAVDAGFLELVDWAVECALARDLCVIVDMHHYEGLITDADAHTDRFLSLWSQIAQRYATANDLLFFELLNEPHHPLTATRWNHLLAQGLAVIRQSNPVRPVLAGPVQWNTVDALPALELPDDDHLIVTIHYYSPFRFTHQGADWVHGADQWRGTGWGTDADQARVRADLESAEHWARARGCPLFLGEFGVHANAAMADRAAWTALVRSEAERLGIGWAYWDFATDFGTFDIEGGVWRPPLRDALLGSLHEI